MRNQYSKRSQYLLEYWRFEFFSIVTKKWPVVTFVIIGDIWPSEETKGGLGDLNRHILECWELLSEPTVLQRLCVLLEIWYKITKFAHLGDTSSPSYFSSFFLQLFPAFFSSCPNSLWPSYLWLASVSGASHEIVRKPVVRWSPSPLTLRYNLL